MRARVSNGGNTAGGIVGYPLEPLYEEVAFIAYHFHWSHGEVMDLEHVERRKWVAEISSINGRLNENANASAS